MNEVGYSRYCGAQWGRGGGEEGRRIRAAAGDGRASFSFFAFSGDGRASLSFLLFLGKVFTKFFYPNFFLDPQVFSSIF